MKFSTSELCLLSWILEETLSSDLSNTEEEEVGALLSRISSESPFSPLRSGKEWRESRA